MLKPIQTDTGMSTSTLTSAVSRDTVTSNGGSSYYNVTGDGYRLTAVALVAADSYIFVNGITVASGTGNQILDLPLFNGDVVTFYKANGLIDQWR